MNIVVDTNIVFSALLNPHSKIGEILVNIQDKVTFLAPELLLKEIDKYSTKISKSTKLEIDQLEIIKSVILNSIEFVSEQLISLNSWTNAYKITKLIDEDDTPFVALALQLNSKLWTGDKKLATGLLKQNYPIVISTNEIIEYIEI